METIAILVATIGLVWLSSLAFQASQLRWHERLLGRQRDEETEHDQEHNLTQKTNQLYHQQFRQQVVTTGWRTLQIAKIVEESNDCRSLLLVDPAGDRLAPFLPGQHLLVEHASCDYQALRRCYSLSVEPGTGYYRITVKKQGNGDLKKSLSQRIHTILKEGDLLRVKGPQGRFTIEGLEDRPIVLLAAGVGVTPMLSMAATLLKAGDERSIVFLYQVRDLKHAPLIGELVELAETYRNFRLHVYLSQQNAGLRSNTPFRSGRIDREVLEQHIGEAGSHFYLCGPDKWMATLREQIVSLGNLADRVHWESFGDSTEGAVVSEKTKRDTTHSGPSYPITLEPHQVQVQCSADIPLLDALEAQGIPVEAGCRTGNCGSCVAKLRSGRVRYTRQPGCGLQDGEVALCVAVPETALNLEI